MGRGFQQKYDGLSGEVLEPDPLEDATGVEPLEPREVKMVVHEVQADYYGVSADDFYPEQVSPAPVLTKGNLTEAMAFIRRIPAEQRHHYRVVGCNRAAEDLLFGDEIAFDLAADEFMEAVSF